MHHAEQQVFRNGSKNTLSKPIDFSGDWKNELGSTMSLSVNQNGVVVGSYISAVSDTGSGPTPPFDLTGAVAGDLLSFTVNWGTEITAWIGHGTRDSKGDQILTLWHVVKNVPHETDPEQQWRMILAGADSFYRILTNRKNK